MNITLLYTVTQQPRTTVGLLNSTIRFTCFDNDTGDFNINLKINSDTVGEDDILGYSMKGITWSNIYANDKHVGYEIVVNATIQNNNTEIWCFFDPCVSDKAFLNVVNCKSHQFMFMYIPDAFYYYYYIVCHHIYQ